MNEVKSFGGSATASVASEIDDGTQQSASVSHQTESSVTDKEAEIETLSSLLEDLEKKAIAVEFFYELEIFLSNNSPELILTIAFAA